MTLNDDKSTSVRFLQFLILRRRELLTVGVVALVQSVLLCFLLPPKYRSTVIMYPSTQKSITHTLAATSKTDVLAFGDEDETDYLMQILGSNEIQKRIVDKYNLFAHYKIDTASQHANSKMDKRFKSNVKISKTKYMSVQVEVFDKDPVYAAGIANDIALLVDTIYSDIQKKRATKAFAIAETEVATQNAKLQQLADSLAALSKMGVIDVSSQTEMYSEQHAIAILKNDRRAIAELQTKLDILAKYGSAYMVLEEQLTFEVERSQILNAIYQDALVNMTQILPRVYIVNPAKVADKKYSPKFAVVIPAITISTLVFATLILIFIDKIKRHPFIKH